MERTHKRQGMDKICLIVGGTKGIGFAIASRLFDIGHIVCISGRSKNDAINAAAKIDSGKKRVFGFIADVNSDAQIKKLIKDVKKRFARIDTLIVTAGVFKPFGKFEEVDLDEHLTTLNTNLIGSLRCCYYAIPIMKSQKSGRIILFSGGGVGGQNPMSNASSYFTSKAATAVFAEVLAKELEPFEVTINSILPGQILTDSTKATLKISRKILGPELAEATRNLRKNGGGSVEPVVNLVTFLISNKGKNVTGRLLSAKWDNIEDLQKISEDKFRLRRIDGRVFAKH